MLSSQTSSQLLTSKAGFWITGVMACHTLFVPSHFTKYAAAHLIASCDCCPVYMICISCLNDSLLKGSFICLKNLSFDALAFSVMLFVNTEV